MPDKRSEMPDKRTEMPNRRGNAMRIVTILAAILTPLVWVSLEHFSKEMVWINAFTPVIAILFGLAVIMCVITNALNKQALSDDEDDQVEAGYAAV